MRREKGFSGPLPPITAHDELFAGFNPPNLGPKYTKAADGLTKLGHMEAAVNADRENPDYVAGYTREARKVRADLREHVDEFADPAVVDDYAANHSYSGTYTV